MQNITVTYLSNASHIAQILTGFHKLGESGEYQVVLQNGTCGQTGENIRSAIVLVQYRGKMLVYDTNDGYHDIAQMEQLLSVCDFYFKRSFSEEINQKHFARYAHKMHPLGMNYHVTYPHNPVNSPENKKRIVKKLLGIPNSGFYQEIVFEGRPDIRKSHPKILLYTRLWPGDSALPEDVNRERDQINTSRIALIRKLKTVYGKSFLGGIEDSPLARSLCPDLCLPRWLTRRHTYLRKLHRSDICIGTAGLHGSVGWKTGEYVAAAKAIVLEKPNCVFPGDFSEGENYLSFETPEQCLQAVEKLMADAQRRNNMQQRNYQYYQQYLKPEMLIRNTLAIVDAAMAHTENDVCK